MRTRSALVLLTAGSLALYWGCAGDESGDDDDVTTPTGAGTQAGTSTGGGTTTGTGTATTTGTGIGGGGGGGAGDTCSHDVCDTGDALVSTCSSCATEVCDHEDWCCTVGWDENCVLLVGPICSNVTCGGAGGSGGGGVGGGSAGSGGAGTGGGGGGGVVGPCSHDVCDPGLPLVSGCDSCATAVCQADDWCCTIDWDAFCIQHVETECSGVTCGGTGGSGGMGGGGGMGGSGAGTVDPGDLVITEIMNNPDAVTDDYGEWFEVYNATNGSIDMQGMVLRHQFITYDPTATHTISSALVVSAGGYVVLGTNDDITSNGNVSIDYEYPGSLNLSNSRDYLAVETDTGIVIDETRWSSDAFEPVGRSRNLDSAHLSAAENDDDTNFCEAISYITGSPDRGTPGAANDACP